MNHGIARHLLKALPDPRTTEAQIVRNWLSATGARRRWPFEVILLIGHAADGSLDELDDRIRDAELSGNWSNLIEAGQAVATSQGGLL